MNAAALGDEGSAGPAGVAGIGGDEAPVAGPGWSENNDRSVGAGVGGCRKMDEVMGVEVRVGEAVLVSRNLDGDRERERRSDRTAELTSTL